MTVSELPSGKFRAQVYDPESKRAVSVARFRADRVGSFDTRSKAEKAVRDATKEIALRGGSSRMTVAQLHELWLADGAKRWKGKTEPHYRDQTKAFVRAHGSRSAAGFGPELAIRWSVDHSGTVPTIRTMFGWAKKAGLVRTNPFDAVPRKKYRRQLKPGFLTEHDVDALAAAADEKWKDYGPVPAAMILTAAWTCVRPSELFELRRKDLRLDESEIDVWRAVTSAGIDTTKKDDIRKVIVPTRAIVAIQRALPVAAGLTGDEGPEALVFPNTRGRQWSQPGWQLKWDVIRSKVGQDDLDFYALRHFGATWLLEQGVSPQDVAVQMGHRDGGKLVMRVYGNPDLKFARARIRAAVNGKIAAA